jgi:hypothetical protein
MRTTGTWSLATVRLEADPRTRRAFEYWWRKSFLKRWESTIRAMSSELDNAVTEIAGLAVRNVATTGDTLAGL